MGSPRKGKNTNSALDFFLKGLDQGQFSLDKVYLKDLSIGHCTGCDYCGSTGICIIKDDMQDSSCYASYFYYYYLCFK